MIQIILPLALGLQSLALPNHHRILRQASQYGWFHISLFDSSAQTIKRAFALTRARIRHQKSRNPIRLCPANAIIPYTCYSVWNTLQNSCTLLRLCIRITTVQFRLRSHPTTKPTRPTNTCTPHTHTNTHRVTDNARYKHILQKPWSIKRMRKFISFTTMNKILLPQQPRQHERGNEFIIQNEHSPRRVDRKHMPRGD